MAFRVGFDVGGTFTDFALQADDGRLLTGKRLTTPDDPARACVEGLRELVARAGLGWADLAQAVHGTTLGSNVVIERKGGHVALLTTRGFRDVLIIGREKRYQLYDLQIEKPAPLVPRSRIRRGRRAGRLRRRGARAARRERACAATVRALAADGVASIAICFLHAYVNPAHERRAAEIVREEAPARRGQPLVGGLAGHPRVRAHLDDRRQRLRDDRDARLPRAARGGAPGARLSAAGSSSCSPAAASPPRRRWPASPCG